MEKITLATINRYYQSADRSAMNFEFHLGRLPSIADRLNKHRQKYQKQLSQPARINIPLMIIVPGHLAVGIVEGLLIAPLFQALFQGLVPSGLPLILASYLPVLVFWGLTLAIGYCFHHMEMGWHDLEPGRLRYHFVNVIGVAVLSVGYLFFLTELMEAGISLADNKAQIVELILWIGLSELVLGLFAAQGWEIIYVYQKQSYLRGRINFYEKKKQRLALNCERNYHFYQQSVQIYKQQEQKEHAKKINNRITETISFYRSKPDKEIDDAA